jgi:predicted RNase H-like HicB family nuclease
VVNRTGTARSRAWRKIGWPEAGRGSTWSSRRGVNRLANEWTAAYLLPMKLPVVMRPGEDGWIVVECPFIPGCISQGRTHDDALANIRGAIELCLENREREGWSLPSEYQVVNVVVDVDA